MTRMSALNATEALQLNKDINLQLPLERLHFALQFTDDLWGFTHILQHFAFQVLQPEDRHRMQWFKFL